MASYVSHWQKATSAAPPFSGAPPIPAGVNVPAHQWNAGTWIPNPNFNPLAARPGPAWMPGHAWHHMYYRPPPPQQQQQQQQQHFNPYKRQPRQPSAEYLATKLSDNPLGLSNMIPAEELERQEREKQEKEQVETEASTPWFWNPRSLDADESDDESNPAQGQAPPKNATKNIYAAPPQNQTPERPQSTRAPESFTSKGILQPTFSTNIVRTPEHYASPSPSRVARGATAPAQIYAPSTRSSTRGSSMETLTSQMSQMSTNGLTRHNSMPVTSTTSNSFIDQQHLTEEPAPYNVLSPLVFPVTPKPSSSRSTPGLSRHASVPAVTTNLDTIPESATSTSSHVHTPVPGGASRRNSHQDDQQHHSHSRSRPSSRQASRSSSTSTSPFSIPHSGEPSPISPTYPHSSGHSPHNPNFSYSHTSKNPLPAPPADVALPVISQLSGSNTTINHTSPGTSNGSYIYASAPPNHTRTKSHSQQSAPQISGTAIVHANGTSTLAKLTSSPPRSPPKHPERSLSPVHMYPHSHHLQFHPPDRPSTTIPTSKPKRKTSSTLPNGMSMAQMNGSSSPSSSSSSPSKPPRTQKRRKGFWNRRGDHVTPAGYIVYAPGPLVYPKDLDDYPDGKDGGYRNENGMKAAWAARPELIPKDGYESLIEWITIDI